MKPLIKLSFLLLMIKLSMGQSPQTIGDIQISFISKETNTEFNLTSSLSGTLKNVWMAIGFNSDQKMV